MKRTALILLWSFSFLSVSCMFYSEQQIKELAQRCASDNPILHDIERYADYYFRVPDSLEDLALFTKSFSEYNEIQDMGIDDKMHVSYLLKKRLKYVSYIDSCFFYDPKLKIGCIFKDLPQVKLNQPWKTGIGYGHLLHPTFYGAKGQPIFEWPDSSLQMGILNKAQEARFVLGIKITSEGNKYTFPLRMLCKVTKEHQLIQFTRSLPEADYFLGDRETKEVIPCNKSDVRISELQRQEIIEYFEPFFSENPSLTAIVFYTYVYSN